MKTATLKRRQLGQSMVEYVIIVALVAIAAIGLFGALGDTLTHQLAAITQELAGQNGSGEINLAKDAATKAIARTKDAKTLANYTNGTK